MFLDARNGPYLPILFELKGFLCHTLPETNSSHLKMDGWDTSFLLGPGLFSGAMFVSGSVIKNRGWFRVCGIMKVSSNPRPQVNGPRFRIVRQGVRKAISISSSYPKIQQICINHRQLCRIQYLISINKLCHNFLNTISLRSLSTNVIILQTRFKVPHPIHVSQKLRYKLNHLIISSKCHHFTSKILPANRALTTKGVN